MLKLCLDHRNSHPRQGLYSFRREKGTSDQNIGTLGYDGLRVSCYLWFVLDQLVHVRVCSVFAEAAHGGQPLDRDQCQDHLIVANGGAYDALGLGGDAHKPV